MKMKVILGSVLFVFSGLTSAQITPKYYDWMSGEVKSSGWDKGYSGQGTQIVTFDFFTTGDPFYAKLDSYNVSARHGSHVGKVTRLLAPNSTLRYVDYNNTQMTAMPIDKAKINIINASLGLFTDKDLVKPGEVFGREEVQHLIEHLSKVMPKLLDDLVPKVMSVGTFQKVLQNLLEEGISIRDMRTIVEVLHDNAMRTQNPDDLTVLVRIALSKSIVQTLFPNTKEVQVIALDPTFEKMLVEAVTGEGNASFESGMAETLVKETASAAYKHETMGIPQVLMVPQTLRMVFSKFLRRQIPELKVLSNNEIPSNRTIKITTVIGKGRG